MGSGPRDRELSEASSSGKTMSLAAPRPWLCGSCALHCDSCYQYEALYEGRVETCEMRRVSRVSKALDSRDSLSNASAQLGAFEAFPLGTLALILDISQTYRNFFALATLL